MFRRSLISSSFGNFSPRIVSTVPLVALLAAACGEPETGGPAVDSSSSQGTTGTVSPTTSNATSSTNSTASNTSAHTRPTQTSANTSQPTSAPPTSTQPSSSSTSTSTGGTGATTSSAPTSDDSSQTTSPDSDDTQTETATSDATSSDTTSTDTGSTETCPLPSQFQWTSSGVLAEPAQNGWHSLKDFSVTKYNGKYLVYGTINNGNWQGFVSTFESFDQWKDAPQVMHNGCVAPSVFYFEPKDIWVLAYQWPMRYRTSKTPDNFSSWSAEKSLLRGDPTNNRGTGPIDQAVICDDTDCYLFFNDDAGGVYRGSMPIADFPGEFTNVTRIMDQPTSVIFEGIQVYSIKGSDQYLMMIENNGTRAFRAWTTKDLGGEWTPLQGANTTQQPLAGEANVEWPDGKWTNDISHGDIVRENPSEKMEIDPCHLQLLYQGRNPNVQTDYGSLPYRPGLLTLVR